MLSSSKVVVEQAEDEGLWFVPQTAPEEYLQQALRRLHAAVEGDEEVSEEMVLFTEIDVTAYLDKAIVFWRKKRDEAPQTPAGIKVSLMAEHYIDAYQSVRTSLFGDLLPAEAVPVEREDKS